MSEVSKKQLEANRENAKKGGVKTEEGKSVSRLNAIKHGLLSNEVLLENEKGKRLRIMRKKIFLEIKPSSEIEIVLTDRIVANIWRLKRAMRIEKEMFEEILDDSFNSKKLIYDCNSFNEDIPNKFARYETTIEKGIYKALRELGRINEAKKNGFVWKK